MIRPLALALLWTTALSAQSPLETLQGRIVERVARLPGAFAGVYYRDLGTGETLALHADSVMHAASTMKVPVMIEYFRGLDDGRFQTGQTVVLANRFASIVDGSPYQLDAGDDSDSSLYQRVGSVIPVRELVEHMITRSSNLATNVVIALVDPKRANATAHALGASTMTVRRGVEDNVAFQAGLNNTTSARDLGALLEALGRGTAASPASTAAMLDILERQEFNDEIPAGLPPGTPVAHKTGSITGIAHDAALVRPVGRAPFVLVVLTRDIADRDAAHRLIADIATLVWQHVMHAGAAR
ncbi:MAG: serine hydrolase [Gemmatimonadota bacterium]